MIIFFVHMKFFIGFHRKLHRCELIKWIPILSVARAIPKIPMDSFDVSPFIRWANTLEICNGFFVSRCEYVDRVAPRNRMIVESFNLEKNLHQKSVQKQSVLIIKLFLEIHFHSEQSITLANACV